MSEVTAGHAATNNQAASLPPPITHGESGVPFSHRFCTHEGCGKVVMLNKFGRCPKLVALGGSERKAYVPRVSPVQATAPILGVRGTRADCTVEGHGSVVLNKDGRCPKCAIQSLMAGWAEHHAAADAAKDAPSTEPTTPAIPAVAVPSEGEAQAPLHIDGHQSIAESVKASAANEATLTPAADEPQGIVVVDNTKLGDEPGDVVTTKTKRSRRAR